MSRYESIYPAKLKKGDTIGVVAPSSPFDRDKFFKGVAIIEKMGFHVHIPEEIWEKTAYLAGSDIIRASVINRLFSNTEIKGIICARGGYGAIRILGHIDRQRVRGNPKRLIGFSDITILLDFIYRFCGLITFHGPMVCSLGSSDDVSVMSFEENLITDGLKEFNLESGKVLIPGKAEGILMGGNLASLCHMIGTPYDPDLNGSILMIEDVAEPPYKLDRMLTQMKLAGKFNGIQAVVVGMFENCASENERTVILEHIFSEFEIPIVMNAGFGHGKTNRSFPIGVKAGVDTDTMKMELHDV